MAHGVERENRVSEAGPGTSLRAERERQGRAVDEVAKSLRLDVSIIRALEADDYDSLPAPIFVKGYLNAYSRLLGMSTQEVKKAYEQRAGAVAPPPLNISRGTGDQVTSRHMRVAAVSWAVVLLALVMVVLWWFSRSAPVPEQVVEPVRDEAPVTAEPELVFPRIGVEPGETVADEPAPGWLEVEFSYMDDCWTEVTDVDGRRLFFNLAHAGSTLELEGRGPFEVFLGNAPAVRIRVNGEPFEHAGFTRPGNVARFTIAVDDDT